MYEPKLLELQFSLPMCYFSFYAGLVEKAVFEISVLFELANLWKTVCTFTTGAIQPHSEINKTRHFNPHDN